MKKSATRSPSRRDVVRGIGVAGLGAAVSVPLAGRAFAQTRKAVNISFWTFDNPQQRPWVHKRVKMFMEQNPHVKVDFQWFAFGDLGKKSASGLPPAPRRMDLSARTGSCRYGCIRSCWHVSVASTWDTIP